MLKSERRTSYHIEFFSNEEVNASGHEEGEFFLGSKTIKTNKKGHKKFEFEVNDSDMPVTHRFITATATELAADGTFLSTSEFSPALHIRLEGDDGDSDSDSDSDSD